MRLNMQDLPTSITSLFTNDDMATIVNFREHLHQYPELSGQEFETQKKIIETLKAFGFETIKKVATTGVMVDVPGRSKKKPVVVIRGDIDALPIHESTKLSFSSKHEGAMHACGHDVHASWALAAALHIKQHPCEGPIRIIFQPAEETSAGAKEMIKAGVLNDAKAILGAHVDRNYQTPTIICHPGAVSTNSDKFIFTIKGASSHGARPQEGSDPFIGAAKLVLAIQTIISRKIAPEDRAVISVGKIEGGQSHNIIPELVTLTGTIRTFSPSTRQKVHKSLKNLCHLGKALDLDIACDIQSGSPSIINDQALVDIGNVIGRSLVGDYCHPLKTVNFAAEDFGYYLEKIPGLFFRIGCRSEKEPIIPAHNPTFYANHESIFIGAAILANTAREISKTLT